jgi:PKD repeat protein
MSFRLLYFALNENWSFCTAQNSGSHFNRSIALRFGCAIGLLGLLLISAQTVYAAPVPPTGGDPVTNSPVYLPIIGRGDNPEPATIFQPQSSIQLAGGDYTFDGLIIPAGVTVTLLGPVTVRVNGPILIDGALVADCAAVTLEGRGDITITGSVDNRCSDLDTSNPGPLTIAASAALNIGTVETPALVESSGDIKLTNDPTLPEWEFALLAEQRSAELLPPVCTASANTLWQSVLPDEPAPFHFTASGVDPDGGPVAFTWDVGDGSPALTGAQVSHLYTLPGAYAVTLTATDDDGQICQATLHLVVADADDPGLSAPLALQITLADLSAAAGEEIDLFADARSDQDEPLTYAWAFGDGATSAVITATHTYATPGRYQVALTVGDGQGNSRTATASVYIYPAEEITAAAVEQQPACPPFAPPGAFLVNQFNVQNPPPAGPGRNGRNVLYIFRGNVVINRNVVIRGQDGGDGRSQVAVGRARGQDGGNGGGVRFYVNGRLTVCGGVTLKAGSGGKGGDATATGRPGGSAYARGGNGGRAGREALFVATNGIVFEEPGITIDGGNGGDGGFGNATGGDGEDRCTTAQDGGPATAHGGDGGLASKAAIARGRVAGLGNVTLEGGRGGEGGGAVGSGGEGGDAICPTTAIGGSGGRALARSGKGGDAYLTGAWRRYRIAVGAFTGGDGGLATATGGAGGSGVATPAAACQSTTARGGHAGAAQALAGNAGRGRINGVDQAATATGGRGGDATATGGDCTDCQKGGDATASAGYGGVAAAHKGRPGRAITHSQGGDGGVALAQAGKGGDCPQCPGGKGGEGGVANATGGKGGDALGDGARTGGDGGLGDARGGKGGKGADCCNPPQAGGNGGKGGDATSRAGAGGNPGGAVGSNQQQAGDGGDGGDGEGPGAGGAGGVGAGIPFPILNGVRGADGKRCPTPVTATPTVTGTGTATPTDPTPTETPTPIETPAPRPVITGVKVSTSVTQTTPAQSVALTVTVESDRPQELDSFFDVFFHISGSEVVSDRVPATGAGNGVYHAVWQFTGAGLYHVRAYVLPHVLETKVRLSDPQMVQVAPIPTEIVALALSAAPGLSQPGLVDGLLITARDEFNNVVRKVPPSSIQCTAGSTRIAPQPLPADFFQGIGWVGPPPATDSFLYLPLPAADYGVRPVGCVHVPSGATTTVPVAFAPWRMQLTNAQGRLGDGFRVDSFFDIFVDVRLPEIVDSGWQTVTAQLTWPGAAPVDFAGCQPLLPGSIVECAVRPEPDGVLELRVRVSEPVRQSSRPVAIRFLTTALTGDKAVTGNIVLTSFAMQTSVGPIAYDPAAFGADLRTVSFTVKPLKQMKLHIYRVEGATTTAKLNADVAQAQNAFNLNGLICTCPFFLQFDVASTTIPLTDWQQIDTDNDGLDRYDANGDGDYGDPGENDDLKNAKDLGYFDSGVNTANVYIVPGIYGGALGATYPPDGQAAVHSHADHNGWMLFHELVHLLDLMRDGDFDVLDSPDDPENGQGAKEPLNAMNHDNMGPFLSAKQCNELG